MMVVLMTVDTSSNSSFSRVLPGLQLAVDSTSLGEFKTCPRKYYYSIVLGWQPRATSVHLVFGILLHQGREDYEKARCTGLGHEEALRKALRETLRRTWNAELARPWSSGDANKNRLTLVRTLVWLLDEHGPDDPLATIVLANGHPAVELSFRFDSGMVASTGEAFTLCGHLDRLVELNGERFVNDIKSTKSTISASFFHQYAPDNQFSMYNLAGQVAFGVPVSGVVVDACQVAVSFSRFERGLVQRTQAQLDEWLVDTGSWLRTMDTAAQTGHWPQNDKACHHYGGCQFRPVCSRPPAAREQWLQADYVRRVWDPLILRGDV
jgi:hypothetical protein